MATVILVEASPWNPASGAIVPVRLAGGGRRHYTHKGHVDWQAGLLAPPRITAALGFGADGFEGGAIPQAAAIGFMPALAASLVRLAGLLWIGAPITVSSGDDDQADPAWTVELAGTVASCSIAAGQLTLTMSDMAGSLAKPLAGEAFKGTGGVEGPAEATGRAKRRSWGRCFNVEGRLLDAAANIYEFGDPARPLGAFDLVKDKGRAGDLAIVAWQGSIAATLAALTAIAVPRGGAAAAPSIACAKWWTKPSGPLTADLRGETAGGYVETVAAIAARISAAAGGPAVDGLAEAIAMRPDPAGLHVDQTGETAAQALDRLLGPASVAWTIGGSGALQLRPISFDDPVAALTAAEVEMLAAYPPATSITVGYRRNHRLHSDGEISAAVLAADVTFETGQTVEDLRPATTGATAGAPIGTTIGGTVQPDGSVAGGASVELVISQLDRIEPIDLDVSALKTARVGTDAALQALARADIDQDAVRRQTARDAGKLSETLLRLLSESARTRTVLRDAGVVVDPVTGTVRIFAVDQLAERTAQAEIALDATKATISAKASVEYVDKQIAAAVLDPTQVADLEPILYRLTEAELAIDATEASIELKASVLELTAVGGRVSTVEQDLDALDGKVSTKVEQTDFDALETRTGSVEQTLTSFGDVSGIDVTVRQARAVAEDGAEAGLRALLAGDMAARRQIVAAAQARSELYTKIGDDLASEATARLALAAQVGSLDARSIVEQTARIDGDTALGQQIAAVSATNDDQAAAIATLTQASVDSKGGIAGVTTTIRQQVREGSSEADGLLKALIVGDKAGRERAAQIVQIQTELSTSLVANESASAIARQALLARMGDAEAAIETTSKIAAEATRAVALRTEALEVQLSDPATGLPATRALIASKEEASVERDEAIVESVDLLAAEVGDPETGLAATRATVAEDRQARAEGDEASALLVEQVTARLDDIGSVGVEQAFEAVVDRVGKIEGTYTVKVDTNGNVVGFQLIGSEDGPGALNLINTDLNMGSGRVVFNNGYYMLVQGVGFGALNGLLEWFGESRPIHECSPANAISYKNLDGRERMGGSLSTGAVGYNEMQLGAVQKCAFYSLPTTIAIPRNSTVQVASVTFIKEDADSILEVLMFASLQSTDDLRFSGSIAVDGVTAQTSRVNLLFDKSGSQGQMPITPFAFLTGIPAGPHTVSFSFTNHETDAGGLSVLASSTVKVNELRKASIGSATGSGAVVVTPPPGTSPGTGGDTGGGGGGGGYNGGNPIP